MDGNFYTPKEDLNGLSPAVVAFDATLPNVLLLGDSISIGYTPPVTELLQGIANTRRPDDNCGDTRAGLTHIDAWLGDTHWDVIHFNWGLHDLCYRHPESLAYGNRDKINGAISVPLETYEQNLEALVDRLQQTGATLLWASTTTVPEGEVGRFVGDELNYNAVAEKIMRRHDIAINDLHTVSRGFPPDLWSTPGDVHFTKEGYARLGRQVAKSIRRALDQQAQALSAK